MKTERTNEEWLSDLKGSKRDEALADLRDFLVRGLGFALSNYSKVDEAIRQDFVQDALLKILDNLDTFRGESKFTTWAQKIAVNVAFTEMRRSRWRNISLEDLTPEGTDFIPDTLVDPSAGPERQAIQRQMLDAVRRLIDEELTEKQRTAIVATRIHGMPIAEVARRMNSNRNALYKLLHDARQRLKRRMKAKGLSPQDVLAAFES